MLIKFRDNIFIGNNEVLEEEVKKEGITIALFVDGDPHFFVKKNDGLVDANGFGGVIGMSVPLMIGAVNKPHVKDIACHIPKYMVEYGEKVLIISASPMKQAAFVACRAICEIEQKTIYEVMMELKKLWPDFDIGAAYL